MLTTKIVNREIGIDRNDETCPLFYKEVCSPLFKDLRFTCLNECLNEFLMAFTNKLRHDVINN